MKRGYFINILILFITISSKAQNIPVLFADDFNNNDNHWTEIMDKDAKTKISGGRYFVELKTDIYWRSLQTVNINPERDFLITTTVTQLSGKADYGHGIVWATDNWDNTFYFVIADGYYRIAMYRSGQNFPLKKWTASNAVKTIGQKNVLSISSKKGVWHFFVNGTWLYSMKAEPFMGMYQGLIYMDKAQYAVDKISVRQEKEAITSVKSDEITNVRKNLGININTDHDEIAPIISPDGRTLFWGRNENTSQDKGTNYDVWFSERESDGTWTKAKKLPPPINNQGDNLVLAVSSNSDALILEGRYSADGKNVSDKGISISHRLANGWSSPESITIDKYYNLDEYMSFCLSADRTVLISSIYQQETFGYKDLYVSFLKEDGTYTAPTNMGHTLNNWYNEGTPFLAPDKKTLYFYSYTLPGYGNADIFVSKRLDDSWTKWSEPKNLGPAVNSSDWDTYYSVSAGGEYAYLISSENAIGESDIFEIKIDKEARPDNMLILKGKVLNKTDNTPLFAKIVYKNKTNKQLVKTIQSDPKTGEYQVFLQPATNYTIKAQTTGYVAFNLNIETPNIQEYTEIKQDLFLSPIKTGAKITIPNLYFTQSKAIILPESNNALNELLTILLSNPQMKIKIIGHTENRGNPTKLKKLSEERAKAVRQFLIAHGIASGRMQTIGKGAAEPLNDNATEQERAKNRRVEIEII